jgi:diguanylate cyclase
VSSPDSTATPLGVRTVATACGLVALALICVFALVLTEISDPNFDVQVVAFVAAGLGLVVCERTPTTWIRFGQVGVVTPLWLFAFAMLLLGSPSLTVGIASLGAALHAVRYEPVASDMVARVAATALSLSAAGLVLEALDPSMSPTSLGESSWGWAGAVAAAGASIVVLNAFTAALWLSARRRASFISLLRHGLASRVTAEGAMLSLAPVWVISLDLNPVLLPILGITTILVFRSTRQAFERANENRQDQLTGLLNRRAFLELVEEAVHVGHGRNAMVMLMDLNGFKDVNDRLGHQMGDALLVAFAERLDAARPDGAAVARLGGDEFALLVRHPRQLPHDLVTDLHERLTLPLSLQGFPVTAGVSIGVAYSPSDGVTSTDLVRAADVAMYKAKRTRVPFALYEDCARTPQHGRTNLLSELSDALARHRLHINFQPQIRIADGSVDTLEALVRWDHPQYGFVPPDEFIGLAEQTDLIGPITDMVLRSATQGLMAGSLTAKLAVNVSPRSLEDPRFTDQLFAILEESSFPPSQLELEITERALARNPERTRYTVAKLRSEGVRIAIDDFGIGYSSYQTLRTLDVDRVKIDRAFVQGVLASDRDRVIVASLIELAHDLGLDVVAEGVEGELVWNELAALGCDVAQGYGIAVPMTYIDVREWLKQWSQLLAADQQRSAVNS